MASKDDQLSSVASSVEVQAMSVQLNKMETLYAEPLLIARNVIDQHEEIWTKRKIGETARCLQKAKNFINGMLLAVTQLSDTEEFEFFLQLALFEKTCEEILCCIRSFKGATEENKKHVIEHRNQLRYQIVRFLQFLKAHTQLKFGKREWRVSPGQLIDDFNKVKIELNVEDLDEIL